MKIEKLQSDWLAQNKTAELAKAKKTLKCHHQTLSGDETIDSCTRAPQGMDCGL
jgi:hypothetical protein